MSCNLLKYLQAEELSCRRIARSANDGTQAQAEWIRTADVLLERRKEHISRCPKCSEES